MGTNTTTTPIITAVALNLSTNTLTFTGTNLPTTAADYDPTAITIQDAATSPAQTYTLTTPAVTSATATSVVITLNTADLFGLNGNNALARNASESFVGYTASFNSGLAVRAATRVNNFNEDMISPTVMSITSNDVRDTLTITFSEPVNNTTVDGNVLTLTVGGVGTAITGSTAAVVSGSSNTQFTISGGNVAAAIPDTAASVAISWTDALASDYNGNPVTTTGSGDSYNLPVPSSDHSITGVQINPDHSPTEAAMYLAIVNDEVNVATVDPTQITVTPVDAVGVDIPSATARVITTTRTATNTFFRDGTLTVVFNTDDTTAIRNFGSFASLSNYDVTLDAGWASDTDGEAFPAEAVLLGSFIAAEAVSSIQGRGTGLANTRRPTPRGGHFNKLSKKERFRPGGALGPHTTTQKRK